MAPEVVGGAPAHGAGACLAALLAQMAVISEQLRSALGLGEDDSDFEGAPVQLSVRSPKLQPWEQRVSVGHQGDHM